MFEGSWGSLENDFSSLDRVAKKGDYEKKLSVSVFKESRLLRDAGKAIESGNFKEGLDTLLQGLQARNIKMEFDPPPDPQNPHIKTRGTRKDGENYVMLLPHDFESHSDAEKIWELLHRNMSIILQRTGKRDVPQFKREIMKMDIAYAQSLRLVSNNTSSHEEKTKLTKLAKKIEATTRMKRAWQRPTSQPKSLRQG